MALVLNDRVKETTSTNGTGTIDLAGAETGFETFVAGVGNTNTTYYCIVHQAADEFEIGLGTVSDSTPDTLSRTTIISSSNSDSAVNFSAGTKDVFCTLPASKAVFGDASNNITTSGTFQVNPSSSANLLIDSSSDVIQATAKKDGTDDIDLAFFTQASGGTTAEAMRIDSDGNIGIGTSSPSDPLVVSDSGASSITARLINTNADANPANLRLQKLSGSPADGDYIGMINVSGENDASEETIFQSIDFISTDVSDGTEDGDIVFRTRGAGSLAERMRITSSGYVGINETSPDYYLHVNSGSGNVSAKFESTDSISAIQFVDSGGSAEIGCSGTSNTFYPNGVLKMYLDSSGNLVAAGNVTAYGSMSDEKLKENIEIIENPIEKIKNLKGVNFTYKKDGSKSTGLIAQDLEKVLPEAVYETSDVDDEDKHLAIRYGNTVGLLVEAIKEQQEQIETLTARVKELKGK